MIRPSRFLPLLLALASPLAAQGTTTDSAHYRTVKPITDVLTPAMSRLCTQYIVPLFFKPACPLPAQIASADVALTKYIAPPPAKVDTVTLIKRDTVTIVQRDTVYVTKPDTTTTTTPTPTLPPPDTTTPPPVVTAPPPVITAPPPVITAFIGPAARAELPRSVPSTTYPTGLSQTRLAAGADLQGALNACTGELLLPVGSTWIGNFTLPNRASTNWCVIRTDIADSLLGAPGTRMTPTKAASLKLAKILTASPYNASLFLTAWSAHGFRFTGVEFGATSAVTSLNALVRFGTDDPAQTTANTARDLIIDRSYVHGAATLNLTRCVALNSVNSAVIDSWLGECHAQGGDSQAIAGWNGPGPFLIQNNHLEAGHEVVVFGGGTFTVSNGSPSDITIRGNHIMRPVTWKGVWQAKNLFELKHARRLLLEGNVAEHSWADAQDGFCVVMKSQNQENNNPWTTTSDITIRYNRFTGCGSGMSFAGTGGYSLPDIPMQRITVYDNLIEQVNVSPYLGDGKAWQMLNGGTDWAFYHNTTLNAGQSLNAITFDGVAEYGPHVRMAYHSNVTYVGQFGWSSYVPGGGSAIAYNAPSSLWTSNVLIGANVYPFTCPAATICPNTYPTTLPVSTVDGRATGADTALVNAATRGAVVAP